MMMWLIEFNSDGGQSLVLFPRAQYWRWSCLNNFINDLVKGFECTLSQFAGNIKLEALIPWMVGRPYRWICTGWIDELRPIAS